MKATANTQTNESQATFDKFDRLFRAVISVPKGAIDKQDAKWKRKQDKKRAKRSA